MKRIYLILILALSVGFSQAQIAFTATPYLQNMDSTGVSIFFITNKMSTSYVLLGETTTPTTKVYAINNGQIDANVTIQKIRLNKLTPGKTYYYKVVSTEITAYDPVIIYGTSVTSTLHSFTLPSSKMTKFNFLAFNDVHNGYQYIDTVCKNNPDFNLVMYNGDVLDDLGAESTCVSSLIAPSARFFGGDKPFIYTRGNHETRGSASRTLKKYVESPSNKYYGYTVWGNTIVVFLDSGEDKEDNNMYYFGLADYEQYRSTQANWLKELVKGKEWTSAQHRIVCVHFPLTRYWKEEPAGGITYPGPIDACNKFIPILNAAGTDVVISGHTHVAEIRPADAEHNYVQIIGGGPMSDSRGTSYIKGIVDGDNFQVQLWNEKSKMLIDTYQKTISTKKKDLSTMNLKCFPNPCTNEVHFGFPVSVAGTAMLKIYDQQGRVVFTEEQKNTSSSDIVWKCSKQSKGIYIYSLQTTDYVINGKIVKQ